MKYGTLPGVTKPVSRIGQGTIMLRSDEKEAGFALMDAAFDAGITLFDSAYIYGGGQCEQVFGEWMSARGVRDALVVMAKGGHPNKAGSTVNPDAINQQMASSLERLQCDRADLYVLHRDDLNVPVGEIVSMMNDHLRAGRIDAWGVSNWTWQRVRDANAYAQANDLVPIAASSPNFSLAIQVKPVWPDCVGIQGPEAAEARDWYAETKLPLITWSSIARGFFSGRVTRDDNSSLEECSRQAFCYPENFERLDRAYSLAAAMGITVPQLALAYVLCYPLNIFALVGPQSTDELRQNTAVLDVSLPAEHLRWLEAGGEPPGL
jgi:aryl-alcohol dehydrogenase-like predicted oxidoreductase